MAQGLAERLDANLNELVAEGYEIRRIFASGKEIAQLFVELGEDAILFDANPDVDLAWYRDFSLTADENEGARIMFCRGDECWFREIDTAITLDDDQAA